MNARRLTDQQLDELIHYLAHTISGNEEGSQQHTAALQILEDLFEKYSNAEHTAEEHFVNMGREY
jgi:hypothetical protein